MAKIKVKEVKLQTLLKHFSKDKRDDKKFCFILGAGASKQSGISTGGELARRWVKELRELYGDGEVEAWMKKEKIDPKNPSAHYPAIYEKRFKLYDADGYYALEKEMSRAEPSCGYSVLAQVLAEGRHNIVITTNFDSLMEDAMFIYTDERPLVCGHEALAGFIRPTERRPLIAKIHRDILLAPKNTPDETSALEKRWVKALSNILGSYTPIVIGYGGNDGSLMGFLDQLDNIEGKMFWCYREADGLGNHRIKELINKHDGFAVAIEGFDEMMVQLNGMLEYELLDKKIVSMAKDRADRYRKQIEDIRKKGTSEETGKALDKTIEQSPRDWWTVQLMASKEKDADKKEEIYKKGLEEYPNSHELMVYYASFLKKNRKDFDKAEEYYKKALEFDANDEIYMGNYAIFLADIRKDHDKAEEYYKKALECNANNAYNTGNYAKLLIEKGDMGKAEEYIDKAFSLEPKEDGVLAELWFYRYAIFWDKYEDAYENVVKLVRSGARSAGWYLKEVIKVAEKRGHPDVERLRKLDRIITEDESVDILDD